MISKCKNENRIFTSYEDDTYRMSGDIKVSKFIKHLRNSVAHGGNRGIHFYPISEGQNISHVIFYDTNSDRGGTGQFCVKLSIKEIRTLVLDISKLYCQFEKKNVSVAKKQAEYNAEIKRLESLMVGKNI